MAEQIIDGEDVYYALRDGLIWGQWRAGEKLKPQHLKKVLNCTSSALREALIQLYGEGFVQFEKHRGFSAIVQSEEMFREAAHLRLLLECEAGRMAVRQGSLDWEMKLNGAHKNLAFIEDKMVNADDLRGFIKPWSRYDWEFHHALLSGCGSDLLMDQYKAIYDKFRLYAVSEITRFGFDGATTIAEHENIYSTAMDRDEEACNAALEKHLTLYADRNRSRQREKPILGDLTKQDDDRS